MVDETNTISLFDEVVEITGLEREDEESPEDFKGRVVRHFNDLDDKAYDDALDGHETLAVWVKSATETYKSNRGSRDKKLLPAMSGLEGDEAKAAKPGRKGRVAKEPKEKKEPKVKGEKGVFGGKKELAATFEAAPAEAKVAKALRAAFKAADYAKQKERSKDGHIVYRHENGKEIHVGPGKEETVYMMGWRVPGQATHNYGGASLEDYLKG